VGAAVFAALLVHRRSGEEPAPQLTPVLDPNREAKRGRAPDEPQRRAVPATQPPPAPRKEVVTVGQIQEALMKTGLDLLYTKRDPVSAAALFRKVLQVDASHYGATFQLARALDEAGHRAEARPLWERVLSMARGYDDAPTLETARKRLEESP